MNADLPITPSDLRKQGARLVEIGRQFIAAGEKQIEAADQIEASYALLPNGSDCAFSTPSVDTTVFEIKRYPRREYISAVDAAQFTLQDGQPKDTSLIYESVISMGARCKDEKSLDAMLVQHPAKFERAGLKKWRLFSRLNGHETKDPTKRVSTNLDDY